MADETPTGRVRRSADVLVEMITSSPQLMQDLQADPAKTLEDVAKITTKAYPTPAYVQDTFLYRLVVLSLGFVAVAGMLGAIYLATTEVSVPDVVTALGSAAIGALAGLLAPSPARQ